MEIKIYQINDDRTKQRVIFMGLDELKGQPVDSAVYDKVFDGEVEADNLEAVYEIFNLQKPEGYPGRSLSVSDVVEVIDAEGVAPGFYYCDTFGFKEIPFQPELTQEKPSTIHVVLLEPGKLAREADIDCSLHGLQKVVGGYIEPVYPFTDPECCMIVNEEGKINGLPLNRAIYEPSTEKAVTYSELVSTFRDAESKGKHLSGRIVFSQDSFTRPYSEEARTYALSSENKAFQPDMSGYSIFASAIDGSDPMVRLDRLMAVETGDANGWKIERCILEVPGERVMDVIAGTCFICGCSGENFSSLSSAQCKTYLKQFKNPEHFCLSNNEIIAIPYTPQRTDMAR